VGLALECFSYTKPSGWTYEQTRRTEPWKHNVFADYVRQHKSSTKRTWEVRAVFCRGALGYQVLDNGHRLVPGAQNIHPTSLQSQGTWSTHERGQSAWAERVENAGAALWWSKGVPPPTLLRPSGLGFYHPHATLETELNLSDFFCSSTDFVKMQ